MAASLRVLRAAPQLLVEDLGRPGWAHVGVPPSGALDPAALTLANRLVGNPEPAAGLEILLGGCELVADRSVRIALTGAALALSVDGTPRPWGQAVSVPAGQSVRLEAAPGALRAWLAVAGGIASPPTLGSRSTDTLTGLGPLPVRTGDVLAIGSEYGDPGPGEALSASYAPGPVRLRVRLGPRDDEFTAEALAGFTAREYAVSPSSDRVAVRLEAVDGVGLRRRSQTELESEAVVTGAVQVPSGGQPLVFLADHPVTGGYPVIGVVEAADLPLGAQLRPGDRVRFTTTSR